MSSPGTRYRATASWSVGGQRDATFDQVGGQGDDLNNDRDAEVVRRFCGVVKLKLVVRHQRSPRQVG